MGGDWWRWGWDKIDRSLRGAMRAGATKALHQLGKAMVADVQARISTMGHGVPSPPGMPPHYQTGELYGSIRYEVNAGTMVVTLIADTPYAFYLEYGTERMAPRPFMRAGVYAFASRVAPRVVAASLGTPRHMM